MSEPATTAPARTSLATRIVRLIMLLVCLGGSFAVSTFLRPAKKATVEAAPPKVVEPLDKRIDRHIRNGEFADARDLCETDEHPAPWLMYRHAVCLERLEQWKPAAKAYDEIAKTSSDDLWANAMLGLVRCRLANHQPVEGDEALQQLDQLGSAVAVAVQEERTRLRACVEYSRLGVPATADPFDATALAWPTAVDRRDDRALWLPPVPAPDEAHPTKREHIAVPPPRETSRVKVRESLEKALEHEDHPAIRLTLANFDVQDQAWPKAMATYRQLIDDEPDSPEAKLASYNLGLGLLKAGSTAAAREAFLGVVDRDPHGPWGELARYWVGRTFLDGGDAVAALRSFRAATAGPTRRVQSAAGFASVLCLLLNQKDDAAERTAKAMRPEASDLSGDAGELFASLWRYRTTPSELRGEQVAEALHDNHDLHHFGPAGVYLAGLLHREIGKSSRMAELYDGAALEHRGPWVVRMTFAAAEHWDSKDNREKARTRYAAVAVLDSAELGRRAEYHLADLALREGNAKECLSRSLRLWKRGDGDAEKLLLLMGRAFEKTGHYAAAADCFAGRGPRE